MISTFIIACVCFGIVFFAPGTSVRQGVLEKQSIMGTMFASLIEFPKLLKEWINLGWIAFLLLLSPCIIKNIKKQSNQKYMGMRIIGSILISSVLLLGMLCVPYYAMGHFGAGRLMNVIWFAFMILSLVVYTQVLMYLASKEIFVKIEKAFNRLSIIAILIVCTYGNHENTNHSTFWVTMNEVFVSQDAVTYAFERDERTSLINEAKEQEKKEITVPPIGTISWILCDGTDRADEMYYGIKVNVE